MVLSTEEWRESIQMVAVCVLGLLLLVVVVVGVRLVKRAEARKPVGRGQS